MRIHRVPEKVLPWQRFDLSRFSRVSAVTSVYSWGQRASKTHFSDCQGQSGTRFGYLFLNHQAPKSSLKLMFPKTCGSFMRL